MWGKSWPEPVRVSGRGLDKKEPISQSLPKGQRREGWRCMYIVYIYNFVIRDKVLVNNAFLVVAVLFFRKILSKKIIFIQSWEAILEVWCMRNKSDWLKTKRHQQKKMFTFGHCLNEICWPFFTKKNGTFYSKLTIIVCCLFCNFHHHYHQNYHHHNYHCNHHYHHRNFFCHTLFLTSKKKRTSLPELDGWGAFRWFGQCLKENVIFVLMSSLNSSVISCKCK